MAPEDQLRPMLLDDLMPVFDATRIEHRVIEGEQDLVFQAVLGADFIRAWRDSPAVRVLFAARGSAERVALRVRGREPAEPPVPDSMRLADMHAQGEWVKLGGDAPHEIAFGAIGRFWSGETEWQEVEAAEFRDFARPGYARIGCSVSLRPYGSRRTLVSYEARTQATDAESRRTFLRYWRAVSPGVGIVMRSLLKVIERETARRE